MKKKNTINHALIATLIAPLSLSAGSAAHAQTVKYQDQSVTIYELEPITYTAPARAVSQQESTAQSIAPIAAAPVTTPKATVTKDTPPTGWLGAIWSGRANLGASLQTGNTEQDAINADASVKAKWPSVNGDPKHRASVKAEINRETENDDTTEDNKSIQGNYDYFFNQKWFFNSSLGLEQDDIEQLDLRTTAGIGLGHQPFESDALNLQYVLGPSYLREEFENGTTDNSAAVRWALDYDQKIWDGVLQAYHDHEILVPGDDINAFLVDTRTGLRVPIKKGLVVSGEIQFDWDNDPVEGTQEEDTTYAVKVGYEW